MQLLERNRHFCGCADALAAARAEWLRIQRGIYSFGITLAYGRADVMPQRPVIVSGWKKQIDETVWMVTAVRHSLSSSGYTSQLTLETQQSEGVDGGDEAMENESFKKFNNYHHQKLSTSATLRRLGLAQVSRVRQHPTPDGT